MVLISPTFASANTKISLQLESFADTIELLVVNHDGKVVVADLDQDSKIVYEGYDQKIIIENLDPDTLYRLKVSLLDDSGSEDEVYYFSTQTKTNSVHTLGVHEKFKLTADAVVGKDQVVLSWDNYPGVEKYRIYKDNQFVTEVQSNTYIDNGEMNNTYTTYEIQFEVPLSSNEKQELKSFYEGIGKSLNTDELDTFAKKPYSIVKVVDSSIVKPELQLAATNNSFKWTYKTFIPMEWPEDPWYNFETWGKNIKYFKGDNRGFSSTSEAYRTKTVGDSIFYTDSTKASEAFYKNVSTTYAYDANKKLVSYKTDSGEFINRIVNSTSASKVDVTVFHKSGNPYAVKGAEIDYQMRVITQKGGAYSFEGVHDRAPAHELYVRLNNGTTLTIFNHPHEGFEYLGAPSTLARSFSVSN